MPPPMPLPGTGAASSSGSQAWSASSSAKRGRIASHGLLAAKPAAAIAACTSATNSRTTGVSRTYSSLTCAEV